MRRPIKTVRQLFDVSSVTGLAHKQSYGDIFVITCIKTLAVFVVIGVYYATGLV